MKEILALAAVLAFATGCRSIIARAPDGSAVSIRSLGNTTSWGKLEYDPANGRWIVENFNNDQAASYQATLTAVTSLAATMAKMAIHTNPPVAPRP